MENNIREYVESLFQGAPHTQEAYELKLELIQNLTDKFEDLVASGKTPEDAYNLTILGIGDVGELLKEIDARGTVFSRESYDGALGNNMDYFLNCASGQWNYQVIY